MTSGRLDTTVYDSARVTSMWTWQQPLTFHSFMETRVPEPFRYFGTDVVHNGKRYEVWSPNAVKGVSYPGLCDVSEKALQRRPKLFDGSMGRNDCGLYPQVLTDDTVHWAFIRCRPSQDSTHSQAEWQPLTNHWVSTTPPNLGHPSAEFLGQLKTRASYLEKKRRDLVANGVRCPRDCRSFPSDADITQWLHPCAWEDAVDGIAAIQRALKIKAAVAEHASAMAAFGGVGALQKGLARGVEEVRPGYMGGWINRLSQRNLDLLLACRLPCFIIHAYVPSIDHGTGVPDRRARKQRSSFYARTSCKTPIHSTNLSPLGLTCIAQMPSGGPQTPRIRAQTARADHGTTRKVPVRQRMSISHRHLPHPSQTMKTMILTWTCRGRDVPHLLFVAPILLPFNRANKAGVSPGSTTPTTIIVRTGRCLSLRSSASRRPKTWSSRTIGTTGGTAGSSISQRV